MTAPAREICDASIGAYAAVLIQDYAAGLDYLDLAEHMFADTSIGGVLLTDLDGPEIDDVQRRILDAAHSAEIALSWPDEQQPAEAAGGEQAQDGAAGRLLAWLNFSQQNRPGYDHLRDVSYTKAPICDDDLGIVLAERDALAARVAELEAEREADTRAVAALLHAQADGAGMAECKHVFADLRARFANRIAALDDGADDEGDVPCVWCHCDGCDECTGIHGVVCGCRNPVQR